MYVLQQFILSYLAACTGKLDTLEALLDAAKAEFGYQGDAAALEAELLTMEAMGFVDYDPEHRVVTATADFVTDASVPPDLDEALNALSKALGSKSVGDFLGSLKASGLDTSDVFVGAHVLVRLAAIVTSRPEAVPIRGSVFKAARIVDAVRVALEN